MNHLKILIVVSIFTVPCFGQRGYYSRDSTKAVGIELINTGISNSYFCSVKNGNNIIKYTPYEVSEYGFDHERVYKAFDIVIDKKKERYFFEQIVKGEIGFYNLRLKGGINKYYILSGNSDNLREVHFSKEEIQNIEGDFAENCPQAAKNLKYLKPNKYSLKRYLNDLNTCTSYPYPKVQYGFRIGVAGTQFYPIDKSSVYAKPDYNFDISFTVGAFVDMPILSSNLSFAPEVYFKANHYSRSFTNSQESFDLIMNYSSLNFPLLFKYRYLNNRNIPFIQFGPVFSRVVKDNSTLYEYEIIQNNIFIDTNDFPIIQKNMGGLSLGGGIITGLGERHKWFGEVRYNYLFNLNSNEKNFNLGEFSISTGIIF